MSASCTSPSVPSATPSDTPPAPTSSPHFVGVKACAACHKQQMTEWQTSHHAAAMQLPTPKTVQGDFSHQSFVHGGVTTRFWRKDDQYWVSTDGPDGKIHDYQVQYTFGVFPLQQYLLALDRGRLQALSVAWDSRPKSQGGQRWFHLYPHEKVDHTDILHWTGLYQNWNYMCADCHSTGVDKGYDVTSKSFDTRWSDLQVACEACHGPGSAHLEWAQAPPAQQSNWSNRGLTRGLGQAGQWSVQSDHELPKLQGGSQSTPFMESCAPCHSRRSSLTQKRTGEYLDDYHPTTLEAPNYEVDGQVREEVYEFGAFLQSKMHAKGVTCRDCHDSHSLKLKSSGNGLCLNCHQASRFDSSLHTHHRAGSQGASCVACHMPSHTFMGVHERHDHSFRIPRPDLTQSLGVPNACNHCHQDRSPAWAAAAVKQWFGPTRKGFQTYAPAFAAGRGQRPRAESMLSQIAGDATAAAIARATALAELRHYLSQRSLPVVEKGLSDGDPVVRLEALRALEVLPPEERWTRGEALLRDPFRAVRLQAVRILGAAPLSWFGPERTLALQAPLKELQESALATADRPESHLQMGSFYAQREETTKAEQEYLEAIRLEPRLAHGYVNLADLYRTLNRDPEGEKLLRQGLILNPTDAGLHHALGLTLIRQKQPGNALQELKEAARLAPDDVQYNYVLVVALDSLGKRQEALQAARQLLKKAPDHPETLVAALRLAALSGQTGEAQEYGAHLQKLAKDDPRIGDLLRGSR